MKQKILIVDDNPAFLSMFTRWLGIEGFDYVSATSVADARSALQEQCFDGIILDNLLPDGRGVDFVTEVRAVCPTSAIIVITGAADIPLAVEAMQRGADHFLTKPIDLNSLEAIFRKSLETAVLRRQSYAHQMLSAEPSIDFGSSSSMRKVMELARLAAGGDTPVLITGETGAGKGVIARWIHDAGKRKAREFVDINCSSLRGELLASVLFGHAKGAFTSAVCDRAGLIEAADGGTLFLDEIGDMDLSVQASFLKVVEEKSYRRLGEVRKRWSDFRLICATNKDLPRESEKGAFRRDLLYRINALVIPLPPLRERSEDIPGLVRHFLVKCNYPYRDVSDEVVAMLSAYAWPGNVRELQNVLERAVLISQGAQLRPEHFTGLAAADAECAPAAPTVRSCKIEHLEQVSIMTALEQAEGDVDRVAELLGISRSTIYRKLKRYRNADA